MIRPVVTTTAATSTIVSSSTNAYQASIHRHHHHHHHHHDHHQMMLIRNRRRRHTATTATTSNLSKPMIGCFDTKFMYESCYNRYPATVWRNISNRQVPQQLLPQDTCFLGKQTDVIWELLARSNQQQFRSSTLSTLLLTTSCPSLRSILGCLSVVVAAVATGASDSNTSNNNNNNNNNNIKSNQYSSNENLYFDNDKTKDYFNPNRHLASSHYNKTINEIDNFDISESFHFITSGSKKHILLPTPSIKSMTNTIDTKFEKKIDLSPHLLSLSSSSVQALQTARYTNQRSLEMKNVRCSNRHCHNVQVPKNKSKESFLAKFSNLFLTTLSSTLLMNIYATSKVACDSYTDAYQKSDKNKDSSILHLADTLYNETDRDDDDDDGDTFDDDNGYSEADRFYNCWEFHRSMLPYYVRRWRDDMNKVEEMMRTTTVVNSYTDETSTKANHKKIVSTSSSAWPRYIPSSKQIQRLEMDLKFCWANAVCKLSSTDNDNGNNGVCFQHDTDDALFQQQQSHRECQALQFKIASYYVFNHNDDSEQSEQEKQIWNNERKNGYYLTKQLAEQGYPDAMCFLGMILNEGLIPGIDVNPKLAVIWWRRCVDEYRHIHSMYELANAYYLGEGVVEEDPVYAVRLFRRAANLGHPGAAYMLGECLLDGVGSDRDRANALEWLITAAELGHHYARHRVLVILNEPYEQLNIGKSTSETRHRHFMSHHNLSALRRYDTQKSNPTTKTAKTSRATTTSAKEEHNNDTKDSISSDCKNVETKTNNKNENNHESDVVAKEEAFKWINTPDQIRLAANIERRHTIGGGSSNPAIFKRRQSKVAESRD